MGKKNDIVGGDENLPEAVKVAQDAELKELFELQITREALDGYKKGDNIKASMLAWSYIEEFFLPALIDHLAKFHKIPLSTQVIDRANAYTLIQYYYLLSHDKELYEKLEHARKLRNDLVHKLYRSASLTNIEELARKSAKYTIELVMEDIWDRETGKINIPSMMIAINARNELRKEQRARLNELLK